MKLSCLILFFVFTLGTAFSQNTFQAIYSGPGNDFSVDLVGDGNGSTLLLSNTNSLGQGNFDVHLAKIGSNGTILWSNTYGQGDNDYGHDISLAANGDILIAGHTESFGAGNRDLLAMRLNSNGNIIWSKAIGGNNLEAARFDPIELPSGDLIFGGYTESYGTGAKDIYLVKLSASGGLIWTKTLGIGTDEEWLETALYDGEDEIILAGRLDSDVTEHASIISIDTNATVNWAKTYATAGESKTIGLLKMPNNDIVAIIDTEAFSTGERDYLIIRVTSQGTPIWTTAIGGAEDEGGTTSMELIDGSDIVLSGHTESYGAGERDLMLHRISGQGNLMWSRAYGGPGDESVNWGGSMYLENNRLVMRGTINGTNTQGNDIYLFQTNLSGMSGCNETVFSPLLTSPTIIPVSWNLTTGTGGQYTDAPLLEEQGIFSIEILCLNECITDLSVDPNSGICHGDTTTLSASGSGVISWSPSPYLANTNQATTAAWPPETTTFLVTMIDTSGCLDVDSVTVVVSPELIVDAGDEAQICTGSSGVVGGAPTGPPGSDFLWMPSGLFSDPTSANPTISTNQDTTIVVQVTDAYGCSKSDTSLVTVLPLPTLEVQSDTFVCTGDSIQLMATGFGIFSWSPSSSLSLDNIATPWAFPNSSTTYLVELTDSSGCIKSDSLSISVLPQPTITVSDDTWLCSGFSTQLVAEGGVNFSWSPATGLDDPLSSSPTATPIISTTYTVLVEDTNGCTDIGTTLIEVGTNPDVDAGPNQFICNGGSVIIGGNPTSSNTNASYEWTPNNESMNDPTVSNPTVAPIETTMYFVTVSSDTCTNMDSVLVVVGTSQTVDFEFDVFIGCEGTTVQFTSIGTSDVQLVWDFGDGTQSSQLNPEHVYQNNNSWVVTLTATFDDSCSAVVQQQLVLEDLIEESDLIIPNVFSPNGDGVNDRFQVGSTTEIPTCLEFKVFNRWGQLLYTSNGTTRGWDGRTSAGSPVPPGVYFYIIEIGKSELHGSLQLLK